MLERAMQLSGIPKEYQKANLRSYVVDEDNRPMWGTIEKLLTKPLQTVKNGVNVVLTNFNKGTGKTFTACALANEFMYKSCMNPAMFDFENPLVMYVKFGDWCNEIRRAHQESNLDLFTAMYSRIDKMKNVPLLILDDIGSGRITDIIRDLTYDVFDKRKEEQLTTIYTSNLVDKMLRKNDILGEMIVSRMMYRTMVIDLGGRDRREKNRF